MTQCRECGVAVAENEEICSGCGFPQVGGPPENIGGAAAHQT